MAKIVYEYRVFTASGQHRYVAESHAAAKQWAEYNNGRRIEKWRNGQKISTTWEAK